MKKICNRCKESKPLDEFNRNNRNKRDGREAACKSCRKDQRIAYRERYAEVEIPAEKHCTRCKEIKPLDEFHRSNTKRDGRHVVCKSCIRDYGIARREQLAGVEIPAEKHCPKCDQTLPADAFNRWSYGKDGLRVQCRLCLQVERVEREYGISHAEVMNMFEAQGRKCAICEIPVVWQESRESTSACIDHCHTEGHVRGILCNHCNRAIGLMYDDPKIAAAAAQYLVATDDAVTRGNKNPLT